MLFCCVSIAIYILLRLKRTGDMMVKAAIFGGAILILHLICYGFLHAIIKEFLELSDKNEEAIKIRFDSTSCDLSSRSSTDSGSTLRKTVVKSLSNSDLSTISDKPLSWAKTFPLAFTRLVMSRTGKNILDLDNGILDSMPEKHRNTKNGRCCIWTRATYRGNKQALNFSDNSGPEMKGTSSLAEDNNQTLALGVE